ncbi:MAG: alcohol dehydrogenase catalytic domain-containing protein [Motiliproteus sp.]
MKNSNLSRSIVLHAIDEPIVGVKRPTPNQRFRKPELSIQEREHPDLLDSHIQVEMLYVGICGTDVHLIESDPLTQYTLTSAPAYIPVQGRIIGHEGVGRIIAAGENVTGLQVDDIVSFASITNCMRCDSCRRGNFNQCENALLLGMETDGLFGTQVNILASLAHNVSSLVHNDEDLKALACLEPAACAMNACDLAQILPGDTVVVFGAGPIGLYSAIISKKVFGAAKVIVIEPEPFRRKLAEEWCDVTFDSEKFMASPPGKVDVIIEASGHVDNIPHIFQEINPKGRVVLLARSGEPLILDNVDHMITQSITIIGCRGHLGGSFAKVLALYRSGNFPLLASVTKVVDSLEELLDNLIDTESISKDNCKILARIAK